MIVYLVFREITDSYIQGFSTREKAEKFINSHEYGMYFYINESQLDR